MPSGNRNTAAGIYCRKCGYDLRAQTEPYRCPECGREFDPADLTTFLARPRKPVWRWAKRLMFLVVLLGLAFSMCWGWLYWGWKSQQTVVAKTKASVL